MVRRQRFAKLSDGGLVSVLQSRRRIGAIGPAGDEAVQHALGQLSIGLLAGAAKMSKSGLFAHFRSKEQLQIEVLRAASDRFVAKEMIQKTPKAGFKTGDLLFVEQIAAAVSKGNDGLADAWNKALKELIADGTIGKISQKYFQEDITCK